MPNDLEEVVCRRYKEVVRARDLLELPGVAAIQMSGSGSAVYGILSRGVTSNVLVPKKHQRSLEVVLARFTRAGSRWFRK
jgi:4-diphosphocytidyl-2C-methyl-D-erythritol kinase